MPTQRQLQSFFTIAEAGSFHRAAEALFISSTALLQQINLMESEIGFKVFHRSRTGVELTKAGRYFLSEMRELENRTSYVIARGREIASQEPLSVKMGYVFGHSSQVALELNRLLSLHDPNLSISLAPVTLDKILSGIGAGQLDCCILPISAYLRESGLEYVPLKSVPLYIGFSPELLPLRAKKEIRLEDLEGQLLILPQAGLFDSTDQIRAELTRKQIGVNYLEVSDHLETELACIKYHACRISASATEGSGLVYRPLVSDITYPFALAYSPRRKEALKEILWVAGKNNA